MGAAHFARMDVIVHSQSTHVVGAAFFTCWMYLPTHEAHTMLTAAPNPGVICGDSEQNNPCLKKRVCGDAGQCLPAGGCRAASSARLEVSVSLFAKHTVTLWVLCLSHVWKCFAH